MVHIEETKIESENEPSKTETFQKDNHIESTKKVIEQKDQSSITDLIPQEVEIDTYQKENQDFQIGLDVMTERNESIKSFDTQEFEDLERELVEETLREKKDQIEPPVVENSNEQNQEASNINEVLFI